MGRIPMDSDLGRELIARTHPLIDVAAGGPVFLGAAAPATVTQDGDVTTTTWQTPRGLLVHRSRRTEKTSATVEFPLKSPEDVVRFLSVPYVEPPLDLSAHDRLRDRLGNEGLAMVCVENGVCLPAAWFSPEGFCLAWAERPALVRCLTELANERACAWTDRLCKAGVDAFRIIGGEYVSVQLGPRAFLELVTPFDTELVGIMHRYGAVAHYHNHGPIMKYLPMLAGLGIDSLDPLEAAPWGDVTDLAEARSRAGDRLCFVGNLDDMEIIDSPADGGGARHRPGACGAGRHSAVHPVRHRVGHLRRARRPHLDRHGADGGKPVIVVHDAHRSGGDLLD